MHVRLCAAGHYQIGSVEAKGGTVEPSLIRQNAFMIARASLLWPVLMFSCRRPVFCVRYCATSGEHRAASVKIAFKDSRD